MKAKVPTERVYEPADEQDGFRILVDLWPGSLSKEQIQADLWLKDIAPSSAPRKWLVPRSNQVGSVQVPLFQ